MATATATVFENQEAVQHNTQIKERFDQLLYTEENQINESLAETESWALKARTYGAYDSTIAPERPAQTVTEVPTRTRVDSPIFTPETLDRTIERTNMTQETEVAPVQEIQETVKATKEHSFSLSLAAKIAIGVFAGIVAVIVTVIGSNSAKIEAKKGTIKALEERRNELLVQNSELEQMIENSKSAEAISAWALANGYVHD